MVDPTPCADLKDQTLHIRLAGVDAPEVRVLLPKNPCRWTYIPQAAHFGKPAQPYAAESLAWLRETLIGKKVYCQLIRRDQYSRIVSSVRQGLGLDSQP